MLLMLWRGMHDPLPDAPLGVGPSRSRSSARCHAPVPPCPTPCGYCVLIVGYVYGYHIREQVVLYCPGC